MNAVAYNESMSKIVKEVEVLTPELKVYPCNFQASPGNEIGFYKDGKIYVKENLNFDANECSSYSSILKA